MALTGVIVLAHGSRGERGRGEVEAVLKEVASGLKPLLAPGIEIVGAALQFNQPGLEEAAALLAAKGADRIVIAPYFLFPGRHITEHVPRILEKLQVAYPGISFLVSDNLGLNGSFTDRMAERIREAVPELSSPVRSDLPGSIEQESMKIVETLLPPLPGLSAEELSVVKRIVHASGDPEVARLVRFGDGAVAAGLRAIRTGGTIYTDVRMVTVAIDVRLAQAFGCSVSCALENTDAPEPGPGVTRSAAAMRHLGAKLGGAVVAVGNSPTALLALLDIIDGGASPALVVGMPVGFVRAEESKQKLMKRDVPYVTVIGTRGGSAMAAAATNALLRIAADRYALK